MIVEWVLFFACCIVGFGLAIIYLLENIDNRLKKILDALGKVRLP